MIRIIKGDCRDVLKEMKPESVHCVVTSPPYWGLRDYGVAEQIGLEGSFQGYVETMRNVFADVRRVLRKDGTLWLNLGDSYAGGGRGGNPEESSGSVTGVTKNKWPHDGFKAKDLCGIPWRVAFALQADGWYLRSDIIWSKPNPMPESVTDRPTKAHEYIFLMSKSERYYYDAEAIREAGTEPQIRPPERMGRKALEYLKFASPKMERILDGTRNKRTVWEITTSPFPEAHFATFPPALIEPCIKAGTSEKGCCAKCGAPWVRKTERVNQSASIAGPKSQAKRDQGLATAFSGYADGSTCPQFKTIGWVPSCCCDAAIVPCVVLDPFGGAGTTGLVADRLGRNAILIELNPDYAAMAERRICKDAGFFAQVHSA